MERSTKGRPPAEADVAAAYAKMLDRLRGARVDWLSKTQLIGGKASAPARAALASLLTERVIADAGKIKNSAAYVLLAPGEDPAVRMRSLARVQLLARYQRGRLRPTPVSHLSASHKQSPKDIPRGVRASFSDVLKQLQDEGQAFTFKVGRSNMFVLRADLTAALEAAPARATDPHKGPPARIGAESIIADRVWQAYTALRHETGLRNVVIAQLQQRSGVPRDELIDYLRGECSAHRANPTLGDPTAASEFELAHALEVEGRPHIYIELLRDSEVGHD